MFKAGFARVDVTPPLDAPLAGYFFERRAKGILDPIYLNAIAFSDEKETAVIITADMLNIAATFDDRFRQKVEEFTGVPRNHVWISCLHQHTSIRPDGLSSYPRCNGYLEVLTCKFADVAKMAVDDMKEATLSLGERQSDEPLAFIRRFFMKDGTIKTNPAFKEWDQVDRPCEDADNTVRLLRFTREEGNDIALVNFSTHPDVIGGEYYSADWPGFVRRNVETDLEGVSCLVLNGVQGDSCHMNPLSGVKTHGYEYSKHMGRVLADTVLKLWNETKIYENVTVNADVTNVYNRTRTDGIERFEESRAFLEEYNKTRVAVSSNGLSVGDASRIVRLRDAPILRRLPISAISLGEIVLVGFGGEPFTHYATALREACPDRYVIAACCTNGGEGYLPTAKAFAEGGYEAGVSLFTPTLEEECVAAAAELVKKL